MAVTAVKQQKAGSGARKDVLADGETVRFAGKDYRILRIANPLFGDFAEGGLLSGGERRAYLEVIRALLPVVGLTNEICASQTADGHYGAIKWLGTIAENVGEGAVNAGFLRKLRVFHAFTERALSLYDDNSGMKAIPPFTRKELKDAVQSVRDAGSRAQLLSQFDRHAETIFSVEPVPPGMNLYRFRTPADKRAFLESLGPEYASLEEELKCAARELMASPESGTEKYAAAGRKMGRMQAEALRGALKASGARGYDAPDTIVFMSCGADGRLAVKAEKYEDVFASELRGIAACFMRASVLSEKVSPKLSSQLALLSRAAVSGGYADADEASYRITSGDSKLDVGFEWKETYIDGLLGRKGEISFRLTTAALQESGVNAGIRADPRFRALNIVTGDNLLLGGFGWKIPFSGQKLPNGDSPVYKVVIMRNAAERIQGERLKPLREIIAMSPENEEKTLSALIPDVTMHEASHMLGGSDAPHLSSFANAVEECSAESNALVLAEKMAPGHVRGMVFKRAAYGPIWAAIGLSGAHQKAYVYIAGRMMDGGAARTDPETGRLCVDAERAVPIIRQVAAECLLLEKPWQDADAAEALLAPELGKLVPAGRKPGKSELEAAALARAEKMFGDENIGRIAGNLAPALRKLAGKPVALGWYGFSDDPLNKRV
ncbi:MAG: hypothetical protein PHF51_00790 [Candidatus ainarchaeum sp.]|nr:hypothetical protein [Candidatus ainarchaeum sp.]